MKKLKRPPPPPSFSDALRDFMPAFNRARAIIKQIGPEAAYKSAMFRHWQFQTTAKGRKRFLNLTLISIIAALFAPTKPLTKARKATTLKRPNNR